MKDKKFNIIRYTIIALAFLSLVGIKLYQDEISKNVIVNNDKEVSDETLINASKEYISNNNTYFNEYFKEKDMEYRIDTNILVLNKLIDNNDDYKGYIKVLNDNYEFISVDNYLIDNIIDNNNTYDINGFNESMPFDLKYVFKGENPNNYIKYNEKLYRIIGITNSNHLKLVSTENYSNTTWGNSNDINYFKGDDKEKEDSSKGIFYVGYIRSGTKELDEIIKNEKRNNTYTVSSPKYYGYSSFVNVSDIIEASDDCTFNSVLDISKDNCNSYLINMLKDTYTSNTLENKSVYKIDENSKMVSSSIKENIQIKKVIYINGLTKYISGNGEENSPYEFE